MKLTLTATVECSVCAATEIVSGPAEISGSVLLFVESAEAFFAKRGWHYSGDSKWHCREHTAMKKEAASWTGQ